ncbi:hypothetical protein GCM10027429_01850 [Marivirga atlantica]|jgi:hypothetical protein|uniref:Uncharacterized protein n=1 Tax=Marivirga atlantica TaxID=1548457 RepID=A0A937AJE3_9BACT|nr:hypothetical protein [Marivirga atlantica]MBL0763797.1 hypothetical protein [Marivirga atlantica]
MKKLELKEMSILEASWSDATSCGLGVGLFAASAVSGVGVIWGAAAFMALCLSGDSAQ